MLQLRTDDISSHLDYKAYLLWFPSIRIPTLRWAGHVQRMNEKNVLKRIMKCTPEGKRGLGRPRLRWIDGILEDVKVLGVKNWWKLAKDSEEMCIRDSE